MLWCEYCGEPANQRDHVIPNSFLRVDRRYNGDSLVPVCRECNVLLSSKIFDTLHERRTYVQQVLAHRYKSVLAMPEWQPNELDELGPGLRASVMGALRLKRQIEMRLLWTGTLGDDQT